MWFKKILSAEILNAKLKNCCILVHKKLWTNVQEIVSRNFCFSYTSLKKFFKKIGTYITLNFFLNWFPVNLFWEPFGSFYFGHNWISPGNHVLGYNSRSNQLQNYVHICNLYLTYLFSPTCFFLFSFNTTIAIAPFPSLFPHLINPFPYFVHAFSPP